MTALEYEPKEEHAVKYDLSDEELHSFTAELLREYPPTGDEKVVCYRIDDTMKVDYANVARTVECRVFDPKFKNDPEDMKEGYGSYEDQSFFFLAIDTEGKKPAGVFRIIRSGEHGFKTLNDIAGIKDDPEYIQRVYEHYDIDNPEECWDLATAAVIPEYYGTGPLLYRAALVGSQDENIKHFFSVIDKTAYRPMDVMGFPFEPLFETDWMEYMGSKLSLPVHGDAPAFESTIRQREQEMERDGKQRLIGATAIGTIGRGERDDALQFERSIQEKPHTLE